MTDMTNMIANLQAIAITAAVVVASVAIPLTILATA